MNSNRRVLACRFGFVTLCVLPTMLVVGWILAGTVSGFWLADKNEWEQVLTERLGLVAQIKEVHYTPQGSAELMGLRLLDAETRAVLIESGRVEIAGKEDGWRVAAEQPVILSDRLDVLARIVVPRILASQSAATVWMAPCDVLLRSKGRDQSLEKLGGELHVSADKTEFEMTWRLPGAGSKTEEIRLTAARDRSGATSNTRFRLDTANQAVPCRLAAAIMPELASLGRECQFRGAFELFRSAGEGGGQLTGTLTQVDLDSLVTERFGHRLSGPATTRYGTYRSGID
jgi:hypothetical protein